MKQAFEAFFRKYRAFWLREYGKPPSVAYTDALNKDLLLSGPDEEGDAAWRPVLQTAPVDWDMLEKRIGFVIRPDLKAYLSTFYFLSLEGKLGDAWLNFTPINDREDVGTLVLAGSDRIRSAFPGKPCLQLGYACVDDDDGYCLFADNASGEVFCQEFDTNHRVYLGETVEAVLLGLEAWS